VKEMINGTGRRIVGIQVQYIHSPVAEGHHLPFSLQIFFSPLRRLNLRYYGKTQRNIVLS